MAGLERHIAEVLADTGRLWKLDSGFITPTEEIVERALDEAAKALYNEPVGTRLTVGGMIIERTNSGFEVYVMLGSYK